MRRTLLFCLCLLGASALRAGVVYTVSVDATAYTDALTLSHTFSDFLSSTYAFQLSDIAVDPLSAAGGTQSFDGSIGVPTLTVDSGQVTILLSGTGQFSLAGLPSGTYGDNYYYSVFDNAFGTPFDTIQLPTDTLGTTSGSVFVNENGDVYHYFKGWPTLTLSITSTDTPEPGVFAMAGIGLVGLVALLRRRRSA